MIDGVLLKKLDIISDERGKILHMMRSDDDIYEKFGEIYFSLVYPGVIKGWHLHKEMTLNYAVPVGLIKLVLYDDRENSPTKGQINEFYIGENNYCIVKIPKMIWNGFKGIGMIPSLVANCSTLAHDPDEIIRKDPFSKEIPYNWELINK